MSEEFVGYVGPSDLHDATVLTLERTDDSVTVFVKSHEGRHFFLRFFGVTSYAANNAEGMTLYSLSEMRAPAPHRRFVFVNGKDDAPGALEIVAEGFEVA